MLVGGELSRNRYFPRHVIVNYIDCITPSATFAGLTKKHCWRCIHSRMYSCIMLLKKLRVVNETFLKEALWLWHVDAPGYYGLHH